MALAAQNAALNSSLTKMNMTLNWRLFIALGANMAFWVALVASFGHAHLEMTHIPGAAALHTLT